MPARRVIDRRRLIAGLAGAIAMPAIVARGTARASGCGAA